MTTKHPENDDIRYTQFAEQRTAMQQEAMKAGVDAFAEKYLETTEKRPNKTQQEKMLLIINKTGELFCAYPTKDSVKDQMMQYITNGRIGGGIKDSSPRNDAPQTVDKWDGNTATATNVKNIYTAPDSIQRRAILRGLDAYLDAAYAKFAELEQSPPSTNLTDQKVETVMGQALRKAGLGKQ